MCNRDLLQENDWRRGNLVSSRGFFLLRVMYLNTWRGRQGHYKNSLISLLPAVVQWDKNTFELGFLYADSKTCMQRNCPLLLCSSSSTSTAFDEVDVFLPY